VDDDANAFTPAEIALVGELIDESIGTKKRRARQARAVARLTRRVGRSSRNHPSLRATGATSKPDC
jgi:hypothetical protein